MDEYEQYRQAAEGLTERAEAKAWRDLVGEFENYGGLHEITDSEIAEIVKDRVKEVEGW